MDWSSGKGKFNRLRRSKAVVEKAISDGDESIVVSMSRLLGLPVYSEIKRNKIYRDFLYESVKSTLGKESQMPESEFSQLMENIKKHCSEYIKKILATTPSVYEAGRMTCGF